MSDNQEPLKIPHFKEGAIVTIKIGGAYLGKLNETLEYLLDGHKDELEALKVKAGNNHEGLNPWENAVVTISTLIQEIMKAAEASGDIEYKPVEIFDGLTPHSNQEED